jgi:CubicO group peptidase (beta-lactamase class C family)
MRKRICGRSVSQTATLPETAAIADGRHRGLQAAAYKDGELIVDAWAGTMGPNDARPRPGRFALQQLFDHQGRGRGRAPPPRRSRRRGIVQGAGGRHIKDVIEEDLARPLGVAGEIYVGIPEGVGHRLTTLEEPPPPAPGTPDPVAALPPDHDYFKAMGASTSPLDFNDRDVRRACLPSANGHFTARALARLYGALANGGEIGGMCLVTKERIAEMQRVQTELPDRVLFGLEIPKAIGFWTGGLWSPRGLPSFMGARRTAFGHPGRGGSAAWANPDVGLAVAATVNKLPPTIFGGGLAFDVGGLIREELGLARP